MHILEHGNLRINAFSTAHVPLHRSLLLQREVVEAELAVAKMIPTTVGHSHCLYMERLLDVFADGKRRVRCIHHHFDVVVVSGSDGMVDDRRDSHPTWCGFASAS